MFLLFQDLASARAMMRFLDPSLGVPLPEKSYAENCEFTVKNVWVSVPLRTCSFARRPDTCADGRRNVERSRHLLSRTCAGLVRQGPNSQGLLVLLGESHKPCLLASILGFLAACMRPFVVFLHRALFGGASLSLLHDVSASVLVHAGHGAPCGAAGSMIA